MLGHAESFTRKMSSVSPSMTRMMPSTGKRPGHRLTSSTPLDTSWPQTRTAER